MIHRKRGSAGKSIKHGWLRHTLHPMIYAQFRWWRHDMETLSTSLALCEHWYSILLDWTSYWTSELLCNLRRHATHMTSLWYYQCLLFYSALVCFFALIIFAIHISFGTGIIAFFNWLGYYSKFECLIGRYIFELTGQEMISSSIILLTAALRHHHLK